MAKHIPYIVFVQDPGTKAIHEFEICNSRDKADELETKMEAEWTCYGEADMDIFVERIDAEKVLRAFGADVQQQFLRKYCRLFP